MENNNIKVEQTESNTEDVSIQTESTAEQVDTSNDYIAPTKEQYERALQSASSKAKYNILKELGINSVDAFKAEKSKYDELIKTSSDRESEIATLKSENDKLKTDIMLNELGVDEAYKDDLLVLARARTTDNTDLKSAAQEVLSKNPNWKAHKEPVNLGTERSELKDTTQESSLYKKYPWLKN